MLRCTSDGLFLADRYPLRTGCAQLTDMLLAPDLFVSPDVGRESEVIHIGAFMTKRVFGSPSRQECDCAPFPNRRKHRKELTQHLCCHEISAHTCLNPTDGLRIHQSLMPSRATAALISTATAEAEPNCAGSVRWPLPE
jgi:hypothetical protein